MPIIALVCCWYQVFLCRDLTGLALPQIKKKKTTTTKQKESSRWQDSITTLLTMKKFALIAPSMEDSFPRFSSMALCVHILHPPPPNPQCNLLPAIFGLDGRAVNGFTLTPTTLIPPVFSTHWTRAPSLTQTGWPTPSMWTPNKS